MKIQSIRLIAFSLLTFTALQADELNTTTDAPSPATWTTLEKQSKELAADIQAQDVHPIHKIDHAVTDETAALQKSAPPLPADQKKKLDALCADMAKHVHQAHLDGHASKWSDAAAAQKQFAADLQEAEAIAPSLK